MPNIVNGFISQFTVSVTVRPFGIVKAFAILPKSIFNIMGKIIIHIRIAIGIDTFAYSNEPNVSGTIGASFPSVMPASMQSATHTLKYRSKNEMPSFFFHSCGFICSSYNLRKPSLISSRTRINSLHINSSVPSACDGSS